MVDANKIYNSNTHVIEFLNSIFIFIVLYLHHFDYTAKYLALPSMHGIAEFYQKVAVGGFFFLAGYKLAVAKTSATVKEFIIGRLLRVYILYLCAVVLFTFTGYPYLHAQQLPSIATVFIQILCLQSVLPNSQIYHALWFVSTLFCCYGFFLMTRGILKNRIKFGLIIFLIVIGFVLMHYLFNLFLKDTEIYLVIFASGMAYSQNLLIINKLKTIWLLSLTCLGAFLFLCTQNLMYINTWYESLLLLAIVLASVLPLYVLGFKLIPSINLSPGLKKVIKNISYSTFCVFLFHRSFWSIMAICWGERTIIQWCYILFVGVPAIFIVSFLIQSLYNNIVQRCSDRMRFVDASKSIS